MDAVPPPELTYTPHGGSLDLEPHDAAVLRIVRSVYMRRYLRALARGAH